MVVPAERDGICPVCACCGNPLLPALRYTLMLRDGELPVFDANCVHVTTINGRYETGTTDMLSSCPPRSTSADR